MTSFRELPIVTNRQASLETQNMKSGSERRLSLAALVGWCGLWLCLAGPAAASEAPFWRCGPTITTPGVTLPRGDISLLFGQPLEILCLLNTQHKMAGGLNSSDLAFYRDMDPVAPEFVTVLNATALRLHVPRPAMSDSMYYCKLGPRQNVTTVCINKVVVGSRPLPVDNFRCLSLNWENLTCSWKPSPNFLRTSYTLTYRLAGRSGRGSSYKCNNMTQELDTGVYSCFWNIYTTPHYRQSNAFFHFTLTASNSLSEPVPQDFHFNHYAHVKPARPAELKLENKTTHSALLSWVIPYPMQNFPPGLVHRVMHRNDVDDSWTASNVSALPLNAPAYSFNVTGLAYAYRHYTVRVSIRSELAHEESMWSEYAPVTFRTAEEPPGRSPDTDEGGFESVANLSHRNICLYWRQILSHEENGDNFRYKVDVHMEGMKLDVAPTESKKGYITYQGLPLKSLEFHVASVNNEGESPSKSRLVVPEQSQLLPEPSAFTKAALGNGTYELTWRPPNVNMSGVSSYTIFWCDNSRDRPFQCEGRLQWERVPALSTSRNYTVAEDKIYQFAISANGYGTSSGMVWASCTIIPNKAIGKIKDVWITDVQSTSISVSWKLECPDNVGVIKGYRIFYCPIVGMHEPGCKEPVSNITVVKSAPDTHANVTGLRPYTTYSIQVAIIAHHEVGPQSDPLFSTTREGAPDPPRNIRVSGLTNTRMLISWEPPLRTNGVLIDYRILYRAPYEDWKYERLVERNNEKATFREQILTNLSSYTNYTVRVEACTVICSNHSESLLVRSAIGRPGQVSRPTVQSSESYHRVLWEPPAHPGGTLDLYEVKLLKVGKNYNITVLYNTTDTEILISEKLCQVEGVHAYLYSVRALNYDAAEDHGATAFSHHDRVSVNRRPVGDSSMTTYRGPWSPSAENTCTPSNSRNGLYWMLGALGLAGALIFLYMGGKWLYTKIDTMSSIKANLPEGLIQPEPDKDSPWGLPPKRKESDKHSQYPPAPADEVSLLGRPAPVPASPGARDVSGFSATTTSTSLSGGSSRRAPSPVWDAATPTDTGPDALDTFGADLDNRYVTVASVPDFPKLSNGYVQARPLPVAEAVGTPASVLPPSYVLTAPEIRPVVCSPYVAVDDPRITGAAKSLSPPVSALSAKQPAPESSGYVKHDDAMFSVPAADLGRPLVAKRISAPPLVMGKQQQALPEDKRASLRSEPPHSPEYCRFGWNSTPEDPPCQTPQDYNLTADEYQLSPEVFKLPHEDFKLSPEDFNLSLEDLELEVAGSGPAVPPASHYLTLNAPTLQS